MESKLRCLNDDYLSIRNISMNFYELIKLLCSLLNHYAVFNLTVYFSKIMNNQQLFDAVCRGDIISVQQLLVGQNIDINCKDIYNAKLFIAFNPSIIYDIQYLSYFWNLNKLFNWTPLICAVNEEHTKIVELLLDKEGIDINCKDI